jgi:hypothetical protein
MEIPPPLTGAYNWQMDQSSTKVVVTLTFPLTFNVSCLKADLIGNGRGIVVSAPDLPPLLHGRLFAEASSVSPQAQRSNGHRRADEVGGGFVEHRRVRRPSRDGPEVFLFALGSSFAVARSD